MNRSLTFFSTILFVCAAACSSPSEATPPMQPLDTTEAAAEVNVSTVTAATYDRPFDIAEGSEPSFIKDFSEGHDRKWYKADFAYLGPVQRAGWEADHIIFDDDMVSLLITRERKEMLPFTGAEYQRRGRYHYGRYEVVMKPARGSGLVSSFFTHTGPSQGGDPHDEVDIEFLGHRTSELHINHFTSGKMAGSTYVQLPYDAADVFQLYAFEWLPDEIIWYVGDEEVFRISGDEHPIPVTPSRLMINLWTGSENQYAWHGRPTFESGVMAQYLCASFVVLGDTGASQCSDSFDAGLPPVGGE